MVERETNIFDKNDFSSGGFFPAFGWLRHKPAEPVERERGAISFST